MNPPVRVLVVEDEPCAMMLMHHILRDTAVYDCTYLRSSVEAAELVRSERWDLLITDLEMPGIDGLTLAATAREHDPSLPVLLATAHPSLDAAVRAVRTAVTDFLVKPLRPQQVYDAIETALATRRQRTQRVLAVGAHPDDVEIGAGATLAQHVQRGDEVTILTASRGRVGGNAEDRAAESVLAAERLGARLVLGDLEDTHIPDRGATIDLIEGVVGRLRPDVVYVHSSHDVHQDHRAVHAATLVATRNVPRVLCYQSPSATIEFKPSTFVPIMDGLGQKLAAIAAFESQTAIRDYLAEDMLTATARYWGRFARSRYAEPFEVVRDSVEVSRAYA